MDPYPGAKPWNNNSKMLPKTPNENTLICELAKKTKISNKKKKHKNTQKNTN